MNVVSVVVIVGALVVGLIVHFNTERRKNAALQLATADAADAKAVRKSLAADVRGLSIVVKALAVYQTQDPKVRTMLINALHENHVICEHCPLRFEEICGACGREKAETKEGSC